LVPPGGGADKFRNNGHENSTIGTWMHDAGYTTSLMGKYLNFYRCNDSITSQPPEYWDDWFALCDPNVYKYYDSKYSDNGEIVHLEGEYQTETLGNRSIAWITKNAKEGNPFFLYLSGAAPHSPATPAKKYANLFPNVTAPHLPSWNQSNMEKLPSFLPNLPPLHETNVERIDETYRNRLRCLQSVDDNVEAIVNTLDSLGILDNTYIIYTSDNGFHLGEHRLIDGKREPYETDLHVPFIVRGPGIPKNITLTNINANNIDIAPTIADMGGVAIPSFVDGISLLPYLVSPPEETVRPVVLLEHWGLSSAPFNYPNNTWQSIRILNSSTDLAYTSWCTSQHELYDLSVDPDEIKNVFNIDYPNVGLLDNTLRAYFECGNQTCHNLQKLTNTTFGITALTPCYNYN